ncbi:hypothetical protein F0562_008045 [Nyssa sinensis]|uniref:Uncharacterized protein n=1 Tax=Nyssa sinensis TaxID=561372 RepID=A0A5J5A8U1_9ASTE|nr:hypothetical protein F0562_008045 [Nyssa sinensis]
MEFRNGTDVIWQIPDSPKAVLLLAHGCNGRAVNFWDRSPRCLNCVGLPEERLIVLHALARNFAVLTISSAGRCWSFREERLIVKGIINWWLEKYKLEKLPLVALGASSADRIPGLDQTISVKLFALFRDNGFVDKNGYMRNDGRSLRWKAALKERKLLLPDEYLVHHIQEELNLAFAYHEMTSLQSEHIFNWFESHMS